MILLLNYHKWMTTVFKNNGILLSQLDDVTIELVLAFAFTVFLGLWEA